MNDDQQNDPFADFDEERTSSEMDIPKPTTTSSQTSGGGNYGGGNYADVIFSEKIKTRTRTFFFDLKKSTNGKFLKVSELSRGKKSTIMMDAEDITSFIEALGKVRNAL